MFCYYFKDRNSVHDERRRWKILICFSKHQEHELFTKKDVKMIVLQLYLVYATTNYIKWYTYGYPSDRHTKDASIVLKPRKSNRFYLFCWRTSTSPSPSCVYDSSLVVVNTDSCRKCYYLMSFLYTLRKYMNIWQFLIIELYLLIKEWHIFPKSDV